MVPMTALAIVNGIAVVVLVVVTSYYAWQTKQMAIEMRRARLLSLLPKLVLDIAMPGPTFGLVVVRNVGTGPALEADLRLGFEGTTEAEREERFWLAHVIAPGENHEFLPPQAVNSLDDLAAQHPVITLRGSHLDALGQSHAVDERMDVAELAVRLKTVLHRWEETPERKMVRELEKSRTELGKITRHLSALAAVAQSWRRGQEEDRPSPGE
jgi:hypothetical protein